MLKQSLKNKDFYYSPYLSDGIILNANESPFLPPKALLEYMSKWCLNASLNRYPDTDANQLINALAKTYNLSSNNFIIGVGSDQLIDCMLKAYVDENELVMIPDPSFSMYCEYSYLNNVKTFFVPLNNDFSYNIDVLCEKIKNAKIAFLCNPNNPTGSYIKNEDIIKLAKATNGILAVDEAYGEFNDESAVSLVNDLQNIIVFKTFSKAYSLAGARIGYAISSPKIINGLKITKPPYNINSFSIEAATYAITHQNLYQENIQYLISKRDEMYQKLKALGVMVYPSKANFLWCNLDKKITDEIAKNKIYLRYFKNNYVRISIGLKEEMDKLMEVISCALQK